MPKLRILIVDDHPVFRAGLRALLDAQPDMRVVAEAADADEAVLEARRTRPGLVLLDLSLARTSGTDAMIRMLRERPRTRVLVLTMHDDPSYARAVLEAGASGYLVKRAADTELLDAMRAVARGRTFVDVGSEVKPDRAPLPRGARGADRDRPSTPISSRERQVLELVARGHTLREIAQSIGIGVKTVETYRSRLATKLGLLTRADLVEYALETGLLKPQARKSSTR